MDDRVNDVTSPPTWYDPRYTREHATSDDPPHLGYPPIGDYTLSMVGELGLSAGVEKLMLSQVHPAGLAAQIPDETWERLAEGHATAMVAERRMRVVVPLRFWWWREDIPTVDDDEPPIRGVRMLAVALAVVDESSVDG
jgi:hypothetical protein